MKNARPAGEMDLREHRLHEEADAADGLAIDWSREVAACDPAYYKWNQWLFLKMLERGIAYRKTQVRQLGPRRARPDRARETSRWIDRTAGCAPSRHGREGVRSPATISRSPDYAEELLSYLDRDAGWPERVKTMQANWIGRSQGVRFSFPARHPRRRRQADRRGQDVTCSRPRRHVWA